MGAMLDRINRFLERMSVAHATTTSLALAALIATADYCLGQSISLSVFYLLPVGISAWYGSIRVGLALSLICSTVMVLLEAPMNPGLAAELTDLWNGAAHLGFFSIVAYLLNRLKMHLAQEMALGRTDLLTGVANRRAFMEQFEYLIHLASRHGKPITVAYIDVDDLKRMNDENGHVAGDQLLKAVANTMQTFCRRTDLIARLGGDEFAIVLPDTNQDAARVIIGKFHAAVHTLYAGSSAVSCSVGVVTFMRLPESIEQAVRIADSLMYSVKTSGKNAVAFSVFEGRP
jgi:diguanylate cyclase (GGDEF)-like protein